MRNHRHLLAAGRITVYPKIFTVYPKIFTVNPATFAVDAATCSPVKTRLSVGSNDQFVDAQASTVIQEGAPVEM